MHASLTAIGRQLHDEFFSAVRKPLQASSKTWLLSSLRLKLSNAGDETMKPFLHLIVWVLNRRLYGAPTAEVIWSIDTTMARVEHMEGATIPD